MFVLSAFTFINVNTCFPYHTRNFDLVLPLVCCFWSLSPLFVNFKKTHKEYYMYMTPAHSSKTTRSSHSVEITRHTVMP